MIKREGQPGFSLFFLTGHAGTLRPVPKSRVRKKGVYTPPPRAAKAKPSPRWLAPLMVACLLAGLAWIVVYYAANGSMPGMGALGAWNMAIGLVLIVTGIVLSTRWR